MEIILSEGAVLSRATSGSAGYDIQANIETEVTIYPNETKKIPTGIKLNIACDNLAAFLMPRSGLATKNGIVLANTIGLIDSDYQGEIIVALKNTSDTPFKVEPKMRICQMIFSDVFFPEFEMVKEFSNTTERGEGGFGSTGVSA